MLVLQSSQVICQEQSSGSPEGVRPPPVLHWCSAFCSTWIWDGKRYVVQGKPHPEQTGGIAVTVEKFTVDEVLLHRTDFGQVPGRADLRGKISNNGNAIVNGLITWTYHPCCGIGSGGFNAAWGALLNQIPGSGAPPAHYEDRLIAGAAGDRSPVANSQPAPASSAAPPPDRPPASQTGTKASGAGSLLTMTECEGINNCGTWVFAGSRGKGRWPSGDVASLTLESADESSAVIRRADTAGTSAGLTAIYKGVRQGDRVGGEFKSSWPGHFADKSGNWYAVINPIGLPATMRFCGPVNCATLKWNNEQYDAVFDTGDLSTFTVELFTKEAVRFTRVDKTGFRVALTGRISPQGNSVLDGKLGNGTYQMTWGTAFRSASKTASPQSVQDQPLLQAFQALLLAVGSQYAGDGPASGNGPESGASPTVDTIIRLRQQRDAARARCPAAASGHCADEVELQLEYAQDDLRQEEDALKAEYAKLSQDCKKDDSATCKRMAAIQKTLHANWVKLMNPSNNF